MRDLYLYLSLLFLPLALGACAGLPWGAPEGSRARLVDEYTPPLNQPLSTDELKIIVNKPASQVMEFLTAYSDHPQAAYVAAGSIQESQYQVRLLLALPDPEDCLDCGESSFSYYDNDRLIRQWEYPTARAEVRMEFAPEDVLSRYMRLSGQATLRVVPLDNRRSEISIMIDYSLEHQAFASARRRQEGQMVVVPISGQARAGFNSLQMGNLEDQAQCVSKGKVESAILSGIAEELQ
jgi:hypothetical protein